eukprot:snap_masked-scaffold_34-processed-gene-3.20-mRNA-1 protein AED:1.00 eAED:1.00 QI:0/0/0/0/1/1/2/0/114
MEGNQEKPIRFRNYVPKNESLQEMMHSSKPILTARKALLKLDKEQKADIALYFSNLKSNKIALVPEKTDSDLKNLLKKKEIPLNVVTNRSILSLQETLLGDSSSGSEASGSDSE